MLIGCAKAAHMGTLGCWEPQGHTTGACTCTSLCSKAVPVPGQRPTCLFASSQAPALLPPPQPPSLSATAALPALLTRHIAAAPMQCLPAHPLLRCLLNLRSCHAPSSRQNVSAAPGRPPCYTHCLWLWNVGAVIPALGMRVASLCKRLLHDTHSLMHDD
jgi:hypothetical protein